MQHNPFPQAHTASCDAFERRTSFNECESGCSSCVFDGGAPEYRRHERHRAGRGGPQALVRATDRTHAKSGMIL
eukprot:2488631-Pleurochrysis_carterae.AAC.3